VPAGRLTWLVETDLTAAAAMERLWPRVFDRRERGLVIPVDAAAGWRVHSGGGEDAAVGWIGSRLKP
jgi:hypothetical protein